MHTIDAGSFVSHPWSIGRAINQPLLGGIILFSLY
jgi:hypothetical protein